MERYLLGLTVLWSVATSLAVNAAILLLDVHPRCYCVPAAEPTEQVLQEGSPANPKFGWNPRARDAAGKGVAE